MSRGVSLQAVRTPRINLLLYHGVLGPRAAWPAEVVRQAPPDNAQDGVTDRHAADTAASAGETIPRRRRPSRARAVLGVVDGEESWPGHVGMSPLRGPSPPDRAHRRGRDRPDPVASGLADRGPRAASGSRAAAGGRVPTGALGRWASSVPP